MIHEIRMITQDDPEYPAQLLHLADPPKQLWLVGPLNLVDTTMNSVAVVGSRACTAYGERATNQIVEPLAREGGWTIVSGLAFGIDAAAHRSALAVNGATIAVLACGVDVPYPRAHSSLAERIAESGLLISEYPPGTQPTRTQFLARNRIIAALSQGTIVVEAASRSGSMNTVGHARKLGRAVMAVPGPITSMASSGPNRLLHDGYAVAVSSADEVVAVLARNVPSIERNSA